MQHDIEFATVFTHDINKLRVTSPFQNGGTRTKKNILQTLLIVIKLFVLITTYNQETGAIQVTIGSVSGIAVRIDSSLICPVPDAETLPSLLASKVVNNL